MTISELIEQAHATARSKGFWDGAPAEALDSEGEGLAYASMKIALMHSELSEALEELRSGRGVNESYHSSANGKPKLEGVPAELADVVIRIADFCGYYEIDLESAVREKMAGNAMRGHKHGKRF